MELLKPKCVVCQRLGEFHHVLHRGSHPEYEHENWNKIGLCRNEHSLWHTKTNEWMAERYPSIKKWFVKNGWKYVETMNQKSKWWAPVYVEEKS